MTSLRLTLLLALALASSGPRASGQALYESLLALPVPVAAGVGNLDVDYYLHLTNGTFGANATVALLTNGTAPKVAASWSRFGTTAAQRIFGHSNNLHSTVTAGGITFPVDWPNFSWGLSNSATGSGISGPVDASEIVTTAFFLWCGANEGGTLWDLVRCTEIIGGKFSILQLSAGTGANYALNIESNPTGSTTHSSYITIVPRTWYWVSFHADFVAGTSRFDVFETSGFTSIGNATLTTPTGDMYEILFGNDEFGTSANNTIFEHIVIAYGAKAVATLGP